MKTEQQVEIDKHIIPGKLYKLTGYMHLYKTNNSDVIRLDPEDLLYVIAINYKINITKILYFSVICKFDECHVYIENLDINSKCYKTIYNMELVS